MKQLFAILIVGVSAIIASLFVSVVGMDVFSRDGILVEDGVPFGYLASPQRMAADENNFYVIGETPTGFRLSAINQTTRVEYSARSYTFVTLPLDMRVAGGHLFIFFNDHFLARPIAGVAWARYDFVGVRNAFNVRWVSGSTFVVTSAQGRNYWWANMTVGATSVVHNTGAQRTHSPAQGMAIRGIVSRAGLGGLEEIFLVTRFWSTTNYEIYRSGENWPLVNEQFPEPSGLHLLGDNLLFLSDGRIIFQSITTPWQHAIDPQPSWMPDTFRLENSYSPIRLSVVSAGNIFVLDRHKSSIDHYAIEGQELAFQGNAMAAMGNDLGFLNFPLAMTLLPQGQLLVADLSPQIRRLDASNDYRQHVWAPRGNDVFQIRSMAFNNVNAIYASVVHGDNRIIEFNRNGSRTGRVWTHFFIDNTSIPFGLVSEIFIDTARSDVYAIDYYHEQILRLNPNNNRFESITNEIPAVTITSATRGTVVNNQPVFVQSGDVTIDTLGNLIELRTNSLGEAVIYVDGIYQLTVVGSTVGVNPSLQFDRLANRLYWIGARHAVEGVTLSLWSFNDLTNFRYDWQTLDPIPNTQEIFMSLDPRAVMFEYPASINMRRELPAGQTVIVLRNLLDLYNANALPYDQKRFDYSLVSFQQGGFGGRQYVGYVNNFFLSALAASEYSIGTDVFDAAGDRPNPENLGRVILNGVPIFKYPTSYIHALHVGTTNKTTSTADALRVLRRITRPDFRGWEFFEVAINGDGEIDRNGDYVGFIHVRHVINYFLAPSITVQQFRPNASIFVRSGITPRHAQIFDDAQGNQLRVAVAGGTQIETLAHGVEVYVRGGRIPSSGFVGVYYLDTELGIVMHGYVHVDFVVGAAFGVWQIVGLSLAGVGGLAAVCFGVWHIRRRRTLSRAL